MDQAGRLERLTRPLIGQPRGSEPPQLVIYQWQELLGRLRVTPLGSGEDAAYLAHELEYTAAGRRSLQPIPESADLGPDRPIASEVATERSPRFSRHPAHQR